MPVVEMTDETAAAETKPLPPALSLEKKTAIEEAFASFGELQAQKARAALGGLTSEAFPNHYQQAIWSANGELGKARQTVQAYADLGEKKAVSNRLLEDIKSANQENDGRSHDPKPIDPLAIDPFAKVKSVLEKYNADAIERIDKLHDKAKTGYHNDNTEAVEVEKKSIGSNYEVLAALTALQEKYKESFWDTAKVLKTENIPITYDDVIRYNAELKHKVISKSLGDFIHKEQEGQKSRSEIASDAFGIFEEYVDTLKLGAYGRYGLGYGTGRYITAYDKMARGEAVEIKDIVEAYGITAKTDAMQTLIDEAPAADKSRLTDARALFIASTKDLKKAFGENAIGQDDLIRYNDAFVRQEMQRQQSFAELDTKEKITRFVESKYTQRYQAIADAIDSLLKVKDELPNFNGYHRGGVKDATQEVNRSEETLKDISRHFKNKIAALKAINEDKKLTREQYLSIAQYPQFSTPYGSIEDKEGKSGFKLSDTANREGGQDLYQRVRNFLTEFGVAIDSANPNILQAQADFSRMHDAVSGNKTMQEPGQSAKKIEELEKHYDITPDKIQNLVKSAALKVDFKSEQAFPVAEAAPTSAVPDTKDAHSLSKMDSMLVTPDQGLLGEEMRRFAKKVERTAPGSLSELLMGGGNIITPEKIADAARSPGSNER